MLDPRTYGLYPLVLLAVLVGGVLATYVALNPAAVSGGVLAQSETGVGASWVAVGVLALPVALLFGLLLVRLAA